jgi:CheY-like chemotaxis protein/two-component sensor histidine kinase
LNLINEVLDLSRIESGNISFNFKPVYVKDVVDRVITFIEGMAKEKNITVHFDRSTVDDVILFIDETRYRQIIINLLTNAVKYNRNGGNVMIYADIINNHLILRISDTGYGIPPDILSKIFDPFYRYKEAETKVEGTGIGLSIAKLMTEKMGGDIQVESIYKKGSTFSIKFPLISNGIEPNENIVEEKKYTFEGKKVLYIEDHPSNALLVEQILKNVEGIELQIVYTPGEGVIAAKQMQPDLILMDLNLPGISGYEVFKLLQKMKDTSHIPVIALSAAAMEEDKERALQFGFKGYITKPIEIPFFISTLYEYLEKEAAR